MATRTFKNSQLDKFIKPYTIPGNGSVDIPCTTYGATLLFGLFQGVGTKFLYVDHYSPTGLAVKDVLTGENISMNYYSFAIKDNNNITATSTYSAASLVMAWLDMGA